MTDQLNKIPRCLQILEEIEKWRTAALGVFDKYKIKGKNCWITYGKVVGMTKEKMYGSKNESLVLYLEDQDLTISKYYFNADPNTHSYDKALKYEILKSLKDSLEKKQKLVDKRIQETMSLIDFINNLEVEGGVFHV